ncbi:ABC transporter permease [Actinoalloteichus hymeniacidonis]|uniref:ABC-type dipeptide/oligopeptide/nickel transport system, permease component n=1 Tax=Actinoalloteichus hymeniacidonis TaxID=340345 RepID=A0AAC9HLX0_9PSEU|nr:ABC transporter permease [Actinoalloteichus hymeniacidonis]AOS61717.1 ABC-type dipeptide/oligopeptide/nickel transport system, permease component [Actinoalloteichus hymeniacidonis]MBB5910265.1 peptide/nickel transport system permease protein [Actinoalloteichus hymeniacidonis]
MFRYVIRRILISIPILLIGSFLAYLMVAAAGDPIAEMRMNPNVSPEVIEAAARELGLDRPLLVRYWDWLINFVQGDWGSSVALGSAQVDVYDQVMRAFGVTFRLVLGAELLAITLGIAVGVFTAVKQYSIFDYAATTLAFMMFSMPLFCVAILLKTYGIQFNDLLVSLGGERWLRTIPPARGFSGDFGEQFFQYTGTYLLPTISLMLISFAAYSRFQRSAMLETLGSDYVRTARAKGLRPGRVIFRHAFRNALIPVTTLISLNFGAVLGGAIMTEQVFGWTGMGNLLVNAVQQHDAPMLMGWLMVTAIITVLFNLVADIVYGFLDPRIRIG